jgi:hypothetical protein
MDRNPFLADLDRQNDEAAVREKLASHHGYQESYKPLVREWLRERDEIRASASTAERDAREIETLAIAKEANELARTANAAATAAAASASEANTIARSARADSRLSLWITVIASAIVAVITTIITIKFGK